MEAMTSFHAEKCSPLVSKHEQSVHAHAYAAAYPSSCFVVHSYLLVSATATSTELHYANQIMSIPLARAQLNIHNIFTCSCNNMMCKIASNVQKKNKQNGFNYGSGMSWKGSLRLYRVFQKNGTRFNFAITSVNVHRF